MPSGGVFKLAIAHVKLVDSTLSDNTTPALWMEGAEVNVEGWAMVNNTIPVCVDKSC